MAKIRRNLQAHTFLNEWEKNSLRIMAESEGMSQSAFLRALVVKEWTARILIPKKTESEIVRGEYSAH